MYATRGSVIFGFVVGQSNMGNPRLLSQGGLVSSKWFILTKCGLGPIG